MTPEVVETIRKLATCGHASFVTYSNEEAKLGCSIGRPAGPDDVFDLCDLCGAERRSDGQWVQPWLVNQLIQSARDWVSEEIQSKIEETSRK